MLKFFSLNKFNKRCCLYYPSITRKVSNSFAWYILKLGSCIYREERKIL